MTNTEISPIKISAEYDTLLPLMRPRNIAVIGASRDRNSPGHKLFANLLQGNFNGSVYPVNHNADHVGAVHSVASVCDLPNDLIDLAIIATPASEVAEVVSCCLARNVKGIVVTSAGFNEIGEAGEELQKEIAETVRKAGMRMIGPNCLGIVNTDPQISMNATFANQAPKEGSIALSAQSGAVAIHIMDQCNKLGIGLSECVTVGNKADVSGNDLLMHWAVDPRTSVIMLYLESFGNPRKFAEICKLVGKTKPIIAVKSGRTAVGGQAASSHTAALMSSDLSVDALFTQAGVIRVDTVDQMLDVARFLSVEEVPRGRRVAIVTNSGGPGVMTADACEGFGLTVATLSVETQSHLRKVLGKSASVANPIDMTAAATPAEYDAVLRSVMKDPDVDAVIAIYTSLPPSNADAIAETISTTRLFSNKPLLANFIAADGTVDQVLNQHQIVNYATPEEAVLVLAKAAEYAEWHSREVGQVPTYADIDPRETREIISEFTVGGSGWLSSEHAAQLVQSYGISVVRTIHAMDVNEAVRAARELGYPVALKTAALSVLHKTDVGGVKLNLASGDEVESAYHEIQQNLGGDFHHVTVQPMASSGVELIVGAIEDASFGPVVIFGLGGIVTEVLKDRAARLAPLTRDEAHRLVRSIHGAPLLFGYRGAPAVDLDALIDFVCRVGLLVRDFPEIAELDLNPVIATKDGVAAVDVKVRIERGDRNDREIARDGCLF